ncbi:CocE/NonD family hydrolase [Shouchella shacheensis]|uniref:CocE/NonD family hydrolase n=1 Tax=Shouchella shacheensis TaxID=1649580 RepID=UPI00074036D0|nr:CocE/NonD family hydrolase [Shouchella shacheensis]
MLREQIVERDVECQLSDGTILRADVYRPDTSERYPVLMLRLPYNKKTKRYYDEYISVPRLVDAGYVVILQDVRGRFASDGEFYPFVDEGKDGYEAVEWAATLPYTNGKVGLFGMSYHGYTQLAAAVCAPPSLKAIAPVMTMAEPHAAMLSEKNGPADTGSFFTWTLESILPNQLERRRPEKLEQLKTYAGQLTKWLAYAPANEWPPLKDLDPDSFFFDFINQELSEDTMERIHVLNRLADVDIPALFVGGWFDALLEPTIKAYQAYGGPSSLWIGPWTHSEMTGRAGEFYFADSATSLGVDKIKDPTELHIRWFNHWLKDEVLGMEKSVHVYKMGQRLWEALETWPPQGEMRSFYLQSEGNAQSRYGNGKLVSEPPTREGGDGFVHDPKNPVPAHGGNSLVAGQESGMFDQRAIESRRDVLMYTSEPLEAHCDLLGLVQAEIWVSSASSLLDLFVRVTDVYPDGRSYNVVDAYQRETVKPGVPSCLYITVNHTAYRLRGGHSIRLEIAASNAPRFDVNLNNGETTRTSSGGVASEQVVYHGARYPSRVIVPVEK